MRNVLVISKSPLDRDPRVYKQILFLKETGEFRITTAGTKPSGLEDDFYQMPQAESLWKNFSLHLLMKKIVGVDQGFSSINRIRRLLQLELGRYERYYWSQHSIKKTYERFLNCSESYDLIVANDIPMLPLALSIAKRHNTRVYLDAHEYEPLRTNSKPNGFAFKYWSSICKRYLPSVGRMTAVCDGIAKEYSRNFCVHCDVLMNLPFYEDLHPSEGLLGKIRMIHHGSASPGRQIENMIAVLKSLDSRFELDLMMIGMESDYGQYLRRISSSDPRIHFLPPVKMQEIAKTINSYDLGIYLLPPTTFNQRMSLPNKFFEYIQARLGLAIWPSPEMVKMINKYKNGIYSSEFNVGQFAKVLGSLTPDNIVIMKHNSHLAAKELNTASTKKQLLSIVESLLA